MREHTLCTCFVVCMCVFLCVPVTSVGFLKSVASPLNIKESPVNCLIANYNHSIPLYHIIYTNGFGSMKQWFGPKFHIQTDCALC